MRSFSGARFGADVPVSAAAGSTSDRVALVGAGYAVAQAVGLAGLALVVRRRLHAEGVRVPHLVVPACRSAGAAAVAAAAVGAVVVQLDVVSRGPAALVVAVGGGSLLCLAVLLGWLAGGPGPRAQATTLGAHPGRRAEDRAAAELLSGELEREAGQ